MKFEELGLSQESLKALKALKYEEVLPVQQQVIPELLSGRDVLVQSKTGSGKTASYAIPEIEKIDWMSNEPQVLVLTPTRELAKQVQNEFRVLGSYKRINALPLFGKQPIKSQIMALKQKVHVVVGTVGRVLDHIERGTLNVSQIHTCIIDEADECLNLGFIEDVQKILGYLPPCTKAMFSATFPERIQAIAEEYLHQPVHIKCTQAKPYNTNILLHQVNVTKENKMDTLFSIVNTQKPTQAIVFCNFREIVEQVFDEFLERGYSCCMIHGGLMQEERLENMRDFKKGMFRFLIASDVAARGIDVSQISHVINFDCPTVSEDFIHRIGRSGRVDRKGESITLVLPTQKKYIERIEEDLEAHFETVVFEDNQIMDPVLATSTQIELKEEAIEKEKMKLFIKAGKNKKLRPGDLVGAILQSDGIAVEDIGIIEILEYQSYVEILNHKGEQVLRDLQHRTIKNKKIVVEKAK